MLRVVVPSVSPEIVIPATSSSIMLKVLVKLTKLPVVSSVPIVKISLASENSMLTVEELELLIVTSSVTVTIAPPLKVSSVPASKVKELKLFSSS